MNCFKKGITYTLDGGSYSAKIPRMALVLGGPGPGGKYWILNEHGQIIMWRLDCKKREIVGEENET